VLPALDCCALLDDHRFIEHRRGRNRDEVTFCRPDVHKEKTQVDELALHVEFFVVNAQRFTYFEGVIEIEDQTCSDVGKDGPIGKKGNANNGNGGRKEDQKIFGFYVPDSGNDQNKENRQEEIDDTYRNAFSFDVALKLG